jgi:peptidoglycan/xylan/chitin deacetylase (PgdA/CDA1 family)
LIGEAGDRPDLLVARLNHEPTFPGSADHQPTSWNRKAAPHRNEETLSMTISKKELSAHALQASGLRSVLSRLKMWSGILTLAYHRVGDASASPFDPELFSATPTAFDQQVRFLKTWCDVIVPADLETARRRRRGRFAMITFDDGYIDNFTDALPILKAHGTRATFFLATGLLDRPRVPWWDEIAWMIRISARMTLSGGPWLPGPIELDPARPEAALLRLNQAYHGLPPASRDAYLDFLGEATGRGRCGAEPARDLWMTWEMVRQLRAAGMVLGGHTHEHVLLSEQSSERQRDELETCLRRIDEEVGVRPDVISYPYGSPGSFNLTTRACLRQVGVRHAFSYYGGYCRPNSWDPYDIPRIAVERYISLPRFQSTVACPGWLA